MEQGKYEEKIIDQSVQAGLPIPDKVLNAPQLHSGQEFYLSAWNELHYDRPVGFGVCPIPSASLRSYIQFYELDDTQAYLLQFVIRRVDVWYVDWQSEKNK